jgi:hypothetical protein
LASWFKSHNATLHFGITSQQVYYDHRGRVWEVEVVVVVGEVEAVVREVEVGVGGWR